MLRESYPYYLANEADPFNRILESAVNYKEPSLFRTKRIKFFFGSQIAAKPPTFLLFANYPEGVHFSYKRYVSNQLRERFGFDGTPLRVFYRRKNKKDR